MKARIAELRLQTKKDGKTYMTFHLDGAIRKLGLLSGAKIQAFSFDAKKVSLKFILPPLAPEITPEQKLHLHNMANTIAASLNKEPADAIQG
jgi:hypothetical protein